MEYIFSVVGALVLKGIATSVGIRAERSLRGGGGLGVRNEGKETSPRSGTPGIGRLSKNVLVQYLEVTPPLPYFDCT